MTDREYAYIVRRTLENKIAFAENNNQNALLVTLDVLKDILALLKKQEEQEEREYKEKHPCEFCQEYLCDGCPYCADGGKAGR